MNTSNNTQRTIGLDMHPDVFTAAVLQGAFATSATLLWFKDRLAVNNLETWAAKQLHAGDTIVLEASANSFEVVRRLTKLGFEVACIGKCPSRQVA
jgi:transposase